MKPPARCYFKYLPNEMKLYIFSFVKSLPDLNQMKLVNRQWYELLLADQRLWSGFITKLPIRSKAIPPPRLCPIAVQYGGAMWIHGGHRHGPGPSYFISEVKSDFWRFDFASQKWQEIQFDFNPQDADDNILSCVQTTEHSAVVYKSKAYLFGGYTPNKGYSDQLFTLDFDKRILSVIQTKGNAPAGRSAQTAVEWGGKMWVYGGWNGEESKNDFYKLDLETLEWTQIHSDIKTPPVRSHSAAVDSNYMYIIGGYGEEGHCTNLWRFDFRSEKWEMIPTDNKPAARSRTKAMIVNHRLYLFAGWDRQNYFSDLQELDLDTRIWREIPTDFHRGLGQHTLLAYGNKVYTFGGFLADEKQACNDIYVHLHAPLPDMSA
eukprot:TRINITY_DN1505_c0_g1_i1.p1 TRINITY_DN1505_c0_g1~~TRINITY_DN1505_c0_g1_i1.p1  ORF type:complete len:440 (+),score=93.95 TRINITY_DN1505_c0_g1_i1:195-1322(+)